MALKRLERWWRAVWIRLLVRLMRRPGGARPDWTARSSRVLFLRHDRAGDMILSTGVMRGTVRALPMMTMDVLASPINAPILEANDYLGDVIVFDKKKLSSYVPVARRLRRAHYDAVIDCMVTAPSVTTLLLMLASGASYRVGIAGRGNDAAFNVLVPPDSSASHMVDLIAALTRGFDLELTEAERQPVITLTPAERSRAESVWEEGQPDGGTRTLINVSAGTSERVWPETNYIAVVRHLRSRDPNMIVRVIGAPSEMARAERIAREAGATLAPTATLRDALALVAASDFVLTPDTSISHAASAFQKPTVVMLPRGSARWALYGTIGESVENSERNLDTLSVDRVLAAVDAVLSKAALIRR